MPKELRAPLFALRAFNVETALIGEHAKGEMLVLMRCQWWRDAVNDCFKGKPPAQPVVTALAEVLGAGHQLTRYRLQQLVSAREEDLLRTEQPASLAALERYAEGTAGQLLHLQLEAAGLGASAASAGTASAAHAAAAEHAASHLGKAVGLAALLRGTHNHASRGRVYLPADLCRQHGVTEQDVLSGHDTPAVRDVTLAVASAAQQHLQEARRLRPQLAAEARPLFLPAVATGMYLEALEAAGFNLFDQRLMQPGAAVPFLTYQLRLK
ncbi:hypothetical protein COHA_006323 [Chlorella ohadii]|uniref:15-cis-phytoene synthase n=1 Tax=Chlorella ohadii TaxID=2649997 RepID=A0AAD5H0V7_9CHLO|nr:hypothetical protein COHA_006323 [Chlorella ohadii]